MVQPIINRVMENRITLQDEFLSSLTREVLILKELVQSADEQKTALTRFDTQKLEAEVQRQTGLSERLRHMERQRISSLSVTLGIPFAEAAKVTMTELIGLVSDEQREVLKALQTEFRRYTASLQQLNSLNRLLTDRSKKFIQETVHILTNGGMPLYNVKI